MSHIFISYSHKDKKYVEKLEAKLLEEGFNVWIDHRVDYGTKWPVEIQKALDECDAFVLVVTKNAFESEWVQNEVARAKRKGKPFFPLLLQGDTWLSVEATQYVDVTDGSLPPHKFYEHLEKVTLKNKIEKTAQPPQTIKTKVSQKPNLSQNAVRVIGALIVGLVAIFGLPKLISVIGPIQVPTHIPVATHTIALTIKTPKPSTATMTSTSSVTPKSTYTLTPSTTPTQLPSQITDEKGVPMVLVLAGDFIMGEEGVNENADPVHTVYLDSFYIDQYEVTNASYKKCVDDGPCRSPENTDYFNRSIFENHPVVYVDWYMAETYCGWREARLPTEAEWEKTARGTDGRIFPWGQILMGEANVLSFGGTKRAGSYESGKSVYGAYDMSGNVEEWVADWYDNRYYSISPDTNPLGPDTGKYKVMRGGSWKDNTAYACTYSRLYRAPSDNESFIGFRCARSATP